MWGTLLAKQNTFHEKVRNLKIYNYPTAVVQWVKNPTAGVPVVAQWLTNPTRNREVAGSVPALAQWVNDPALP